jgi:hypothetical protein
LNFTQLEKDAEVDRILAGEEQFTLLTVFFFNFNYYFSVLENVHVFYEWLSGDLGALAFDEGDIAAIMEEARKDGTLTDI